MKKLILPCIALLLAACAHSPQQITLAPSAVLDGERIGNSRAVVVSAESRLPSNSIGALGGIYKDGGQIIIANDIPEAVVRATEASLAAMGFSINSPNQDPSTTAQLHIVVEKLTYTRLESTVGTKIELSALLEAQVTSGNEQYSGRYQTRTENTLAMTPDEKENTEMINKMVTDTLRRLFADPKMRSLLGSM